MQRSLRVLAMEATVVPLSAGVLAIGASLLGLGASVALAVAYLAASLAAALARPAIPSVGRVVGHDVDRYLQDLWAAFALAGLTVLFMLGSSPGELQALGGILGLVGMANYFLRPVYFLVLRLGARIARAA